MATGARRSDLTGVLPMAAAPDCMSLLLRVSLQVLVQEHLPQNWLGPKPFPLQDYGKMMYRLRGRWRSPAMGRDTGDLLQGTLGLLILKALASEERHGYGIARWIEDVTGGVLRIEEGSLYPALRRLEDRGFIESR